MKKKVGIITFHASYNHGSVFQAQATQQAIQNLGYDAEIIDYRPKTYDDYDRLYCRRGHSGIKGRLYYALLRIHRTQRLERIQKFQQYQHENLCLSQKRYLTYDSLSEIANAYDMFVSGSDQIWSKNVPEIAIDSERAVLAYYLGFTQRKKIAYASSVASMKEKDLKEFQLCLYFYARGNWRRTIVTYHRKRYNNSCRSFFFIRPSGMDTFCGTAEIGRWKIRIALLFEKLRCRKKLERCTEHIRRAAWIKNCCDRSVF